MSDILIWIGIAFCVSQSAIFSGSNIAVFSLSRLRLESAAATGDRSAIRALSLRHDANFTLVTILVGNVAINVLLTLLADSVLAGVMAFLFSTVVITAVGEIVPQAYFSRNALKAVSFLAPILSIYRVLLWPIAKPIGMFLDVWVGEEAIPWFRERELGEILHHHAGSSETEVGRIEAIGAMNFLALDDLRLENEGEPLAANRIVKLPSRGGEIIFPSISPSVDDDFLRRISASGARWIVITDEDSQPYCLIDAYRLAGNALFAHGLVIPQSYCVRPVIAHDPKKTVGEALGELMERVETGRRNGHDVILVWSPEVKRLITGSDLFACLLRGISD